MVGPGVGWPTLAVHPAAVGLEVVAHLLPVIDCSGGGSGSPLVR